MLHIVGVGICRGHLTERAIRLIQNADIVCGSSRALKLAEEHIRGEKWLIKVHSGEEYERLKRESEDRNVVVLSTGDPMVSGLGTKLDGVVEPGISSVQIALSKLGIDLCDVAVVDAHAKKPENLMNLLKFRHALILGDKNFDLSIFGGKEVCILENLCMKNERVIVGRADEVEISSNYTIIFVRR
jgi:cobalt-precorrin-7 (C5)-methyltransferase